LLLADLLWIAFVLAGTSALGGVPQEADVSPAAADDRAMHPVARHG
jgi:hypothetical protein